VGPVPPGGPERHNARFGPRPPPSVKTTSTENLAKLSLPQKSNDRSPSNTLKTPAVPFSFRSFVESLGLPGNKQSELLVTLARFFSLPLQGAPLQQAQREARNLGGPWESALMALLSAASKGVNLKEATLRSYIRAIDPSLRERKTGHFSTEPGEPGIPGPEEDLPVEKLPDDAFARGDGGSKDSGGSDGTGTGGGGDGAGSDGRPGGGSDKGTDGRSGADVEAGPRTLEAALAKGAEPSLSGPGALAFLNRLDLSSGKKWLVLPFSFSFNNIDFELTVRLLYSVKEDANPVERMTMDLFFPPGGSIKENKRRWVFTLVNPITENSKLIVTREPSFSENEKRAYALRLEGIVQPYAKQVFFEDSLKTEGTIDDPATLFTPVEEHV